MEYLIEKIEHYKKVFLVCYNMLIYHYWAKAIAIAKYIQNRLPTKLVFGKVLKEVWSREKPSIANLKIFGCKAYSHIPKKRRKLEPKSLEYVFIGYIEGIKGHNLYNTKSRRVFYSRDVVF
jgi:hypothetical protein